MERGAPGLARHGTSPCTFFFGVIELAAAAAATSGLDPQTRINMPERGRILTVPLWAGMRAELINSRPALRRSCVQIYNI